MLVFGHTLIPYKSWQRVDSINDILNTPTGSIILLSDLQYSSDIALHCTKNDIPYAVKVISIKDAVIAANLGAAYALCNIENAQEIQKIANEYLWTMRIITPIDDENEIESIALMGIDGVIFKNSICE
ncbi:MAG: hypothetical protein JXQ77_01305 [Campylobacterales bacterium]|nr:hypothetical protein [Campylobacterales bacterium]